MKRSVDAVSQGQKDLDWCCKAAKFKKNEMSFLETLENDLKILGDQGPVAAPVLQKKRNGNGKIALAGVLSKHSQVHIDKEHKLKQKLDTLSTKKKFQYKDDLLKELKAKQVDEDQQQYVRRHFDEFANDPWEQADNRREMEDTIHSLSQNAEREKRNGNDKIALAGVILSKHSQIHIDKELRELQNKLKQKQELLSTHSQVHVDKRLRELQNKLKQKLDTLSTKKKFQKYKDDLLKELKAKLVDEEQQQYVRRRFDEFANDLWEQADKRREMEDKIHSLSQKAEREKRKRKAAEEEKEKAHLDADNAKKESTRLASEKAAAERKAKVSQKRADKQKAAAEEMARVTAKKAKTEKARKQKVLREKRKAEVALAALSAAAKRDRIALEKAEADEKARIAAEKARTAEKAAADEKAGKAAEKAAADEKARIVITIDVSTLGIQRRTHRVKGGSQSS